MSIAKPQAVVRGKYPGRVARPARSPAPPYWRLVAAGEPFRLLFPLGTAVGIAGVLMWPLYIWNVTSIYPGPLHPRVMVEGFTGCFVIGFLGTALPRLLGVPKVSIYETLGFGAALVWTSCLHYTGRTMWGDLTFFSTVLALVFLLGVRTLFRKDTPPPAFVLVAMGLLSALVGSFGLAASQVAPGLTPAWLPPFGKLLLYQGFILLPIMGIGAFLLPRFSDSRTGRASQNRCRCLPDGCRGRCLPGPVAWQSSPVLPWKLRDSHRRATH